MNPLRRYAVDAALIGAAVVLSACTTAPPPAQAPATDSASVLGPVVTLGVPGADNRGVTLASDGSRVLALWAAATETATDIMAAASTDSGAVFAAPVRVNDIAGDARANGEQPPQAGITGNQVVAVWQSRRSGVSEVRIARSENGGQTFAPAATVHAGGLKGARGWSSLAVTPRGDALVAWLDGRLAVPAERPKLPSPTPSPSPPAAGHHGHGASMRQDLYFAAQAAGAAAHESPVTTDVCFCCKTSTASGPAGAVYVAFRDIYPGSLRDMSVARSVDGGKTFDAPVRVSEDGWELTGCPEDGPSIAVDAAGVLHLAWPTLVDAKTDRKAIFYTYSIDQGRTFAPRMRVDQGDDVRHAQHPRLAAANGRVVVVWDESLASGPRIRARVVRSSSSSAWSPVAGDIVTVSEPVAVTYPAVAMVSDGAVIGWVRTSATGAGIQVRRLGFK